LLQEEAEFKNLDLTTFDKVYVKDELSRIQAEIKILEKAHYYVFSNQEIESIIDLIGEPIIKNELRSLFNEYLKIDERAEIINEIKLKMSKYEINKNEL